MTTTPTNQAPVSAAPPFAPPIPCELCPCPATHKRVKLDLDKPGMNAGECGYRDQYLCACCVLPYRGDNCSRVEALPERVWESPNPWEDYPEEPEPTPATTAPGHGDEDYVRAEWAERERDETY